MSFCLVLEIRTPGLDKAILDAATIIAEAITGLVPPPHIVTGSLRLDPQGDAPMALGQSNPALPQHISAAWTNQDGTPGTPTSVDWSLSDPTLGTITPDAAAPTAGAVFMAASPTSTANVGVTAVAHQPNAPDVTASISFTLVPVVVANPIVSGTLTLDPQTPASGSGGPVISTAAAGKPLFKR